MAGTVPRPHEIAPMPRFRIGLVTCVAEKLRDYFPTSAEPDFVPTEPPFTPDDQLLVDELRRHGHEVLPVIWGRDVSGLAESVDLLVVRSAWDFMDSEEQRRRFMGWIGELERAGIAVENHPRVMAWLNDKRYLKDIENSGVSVVPTRVVAPGEPPCLADLFDTEGPLIVKPSVSGAGVGLVFLTSRSAAVEFQPQFEACCRDQWYLVQPFVPEIRTAGEWSLVYLGGAYSHAVHKLPGEGKILVHAEQGGSLRFAEPPADVRAAGDRAVSRIEQAFTLRHSAHAIRFPPLYLRVDVIPSAVGPILSECEGVEPELFFRARPGSEALFRRFLEERMQA
jgi:hypothetical protein